MKAKRYTLAWSSESEDLIRQINALLDEGWELYGDTSVRIVPGGEESIGGTIFSQAMISEVQ